MRKAKEPPHPPHRVTLSSGEKGKSRRKGFFSVPHPLLVTQLPLNQILTSLSPGLYLGRLVMSFVRGGQRVVSFPTLPFLLLSGPFLSSGGGGCNSHSLSFRSWPFAFDPLNSTARVVPYCPICGPHSAKAGPGLTFLSSLTWTRNQS